MGPYGFSLYSIVVIIVAILISVANLSLAFYVYKKSPKEKINREFAYLAGINGLWCLTNLWSTVSQNYFSTVTSYAVGSLVPVAGLIFASTLAGQKFGTFTKILISIVSCFFFIVCFTPLIISKIYSYTTFNYGMRPGSLFAVWCAYLIIFTTLCLIILFSAIPRVDEKTKQQIKYLLLGITLFALWEMTMSAILPIMGHTSVAGDIDYFGTIFLTGFTSYAIIKHNVLGIKSLFFYAFVVSLVIISMSLIIILLMFLGAWFFKNLGYTGILLVALICSVLIILIGNSFFRKTRDLEKSKISLIKSLDESEKNRTIAQEEKDKTQAVIANFSDGILMLDSKN
jgi:hypothetical protein